jgi:hypothetical protein
MAKVPEYSRRARGVPVWAALRSLGRTGVASLVEGMVENAGAMAERLSEIDGGSVLNDVTCTQVCLAFGDDGTTRVQGRGSSSNRDSVPGGRVGQHVDVVTRVQRMVERALEQENQAAVGASGPIGYWPLDETSGTTAYDAAPGALNGTIQGGVTLGVPAPIAGATAMQFDGGNCTGINLDVAATALAVDFPTIEMWIQTSDTPAAFLFRWRYYGYQLYATNSSVGFTGYSPNGAPNWRFAGKAQSMTVPGTTSLPRQALRLPPCTSRDSRSRVEQESSGTSSPTASSPRSPWTATRVTE